VKRSNNYVIFVNEIHKTIDKAYTTYIHILRYSVTLKFGILGYLVSIVLSNCDC